MKNIAIIGLLSLGAVGAYAQGTIVFGNNQGGFIQHIYAPNPASMNVQQLGASASDTPAGTTVYGGVPIGGSSGGVGLNYANGNQFTAQLYAYQVGSGALNQPLSSLTPVAAYVTTLAVAGGAPNAGFIVANNQTPDPGVNIPNTLTDAGNGTLDNKDTLAMAAWYNAGGTLTSLAAASAANMPYGMSAPWNQFGLGEPANVNTAANGGSTTGPSQPAVMGNQRSFSLVQNVPEPSTIALGVMGIGAFLARRRMK